MDTDTLYRSKDKRIELIRHTHSEGNQWLVLEHDNLMDTTHRFDISLEDALGIKAAIEKFYRELIKT